MHTREPKEALGRLAQHGAPRVWDDGIREAFSPLPSLPPFPYTTHTHTHARTLQLRPIRAAAGLPRAGLHTKPRPCTHNTAQAGAHAHTIGRRAPRRGPSPGSRPARRRGPPSVHTRAGRRSPGKRRGHDSSPAAASRAPKKVRRTPPDSPAALLSSRHSGPSSHMARPRLPLPGAVAAPAASALTPPLAAPAPPPAVPPPARPALLGQAGRGPAPRSFASVPAARRARVLPRVSRLGEAAEEAAEGPALAASRRQPPLAAKI